jgi:hypothetical protein
MTDNLGVCLTHRVSVCLMTTVSVYDTQLSPLLLILYASIISVVQKYTEDMPVAFSCRKLLASSYPCMGGPACVSYLDFDSVLVRGTSID